MARVEKSHWEGEEEELRSGAREKILADVERSTGVRHGDDGPGQRNASLARPAWIPSETPWHEAERELDGLSDRFHLARSPQELHRVLMDIVREHDISRAIRWDHPLLEDLKIDASLRECGVEVAIPSREKEGKVISARAGLGITAADAFVMESGTIVLRSRAGQGRATSLLPPVHLAIVTSDRRLGRLEDLPGLVRYWREEADGLPRAITLITGHSRTADIELTLVSGVHGPGIVHVVGMDPLSLLVANGSRRSTQHQ
jgi:L-lactate dehydrogenase complex protein LldG